MIFDNFGRKKKAILNLLVVLSFTDALTQNVRENENTLFMDSLQDNIQLFIQNGFIVKGQFSYKDDENQFIYIIEKIV